MDRLQIACIPKWSPKATDAIRRSDLREKEDSSKRMFLMGMDPMIRAIPNHLARCSIFAPTARGRKIYYDNVRLVSRRDAVITYSGWQITEQQGEVWMQLIFESRNTEVGQPVLINRAKVLREIGRKTSGRDYKFLDQTLNILLNATLMIENVTRDGQLIYSVGQDSPLHMVSGVGLETQTETLIIVIDPRWKKIFGECEYAIIDWHKRMRIRKGQDIAKAIQRILCASSDTVQKLKLKELKLVLQYLSPMNKFRKSLGEAARELDRVEIIEDWDFTHLKNGEECLEIKRKVK